MDRLTFEGNFCDISRCQNTPGGSFCEDGACSQRKVWERLEVRETPDGGLRGVILGITPERPETNGDRIRSMSDEELATEIIRRWRSEMEDVFHEDISKRWCDMQGGCVSSKGYHRPCTDNRLFACVLRWLRAPAKEGK